MIKKILVPVDGSEHANRALEFALDLAQKYSAEILVLSIIQYPRTGEKEPTDIVEYYQWIEASNENVLSTALEKATKIAPNLIITSKLIEGYPADEIIKTAEEGDFDLIVMGRRGRGHLTHTLLGSVSDRVADQASCALLIVK